MFSSNSVKTGGILDHETDIISFASRLKKSKVYYVAKEMKVYELATGSGCGLNGEPHGTIISKKNLSRKWAKIDRGTVCKAVRLVSVDNSDKTPDYVSLLCQLACCDFKSKKKNSDIAIEFKVVNNLYELKKDEYDDQRDNELNQLPKATPSDKTYFLPVYETCSNNEIDLIPISSIIKNNRFKTNSLHLAKNLVQHDSLINDLIELKLFDENPFDHKLNKCAENHHHHHHHQFTVPFHFPRRHTASAEQKDPLNDLMKDNQHLELDKYASIFDLIEFRHNCEIIIGFNLSKNCLFVTSTNLPTAGSNIKHEPAIVKQVVYSKLNVDSAELDEEKTSIIRQFKADKLEKFLKAAQIEYNSFNRTINKLETFTNNVFKNISSSEFYTKSNLNNEKCQLPQSPNQQCLKNLHLLNNKPSTGAPIKTVSTITQFSDLVHVMMMDSPSVWVKLPDSTCDVKHAKLLKKAFHYKTLPVKQHAQWSVETKTEKGKDTVESNTVENDLTSRECFHQRRNSLPLNVRKKFNNLDSK